MECGGKRSATPLWLEGLVLRWIRHKHKPKRRRASLAAALHMAVAETFNRTPPTPRWHDPMAFRVLLSHYESSLAWSLLATPLAVRDPARLAACVCRSASF